MDKFGNIDSKYRFIILASKRAKQLLKGAKPKIQGKSKSLIRIAQAEVKAGLIEYEIIPTRMDDLPERDDRVFVGAGIPDEPGESEGIAAKDIVEGDAEVVLGGEIEENEAGDEDAEDEDGGAKDDKDE
ncbi:MAG: DNA-directed RNA polymerase subunit omega [Candidatus Aminicenantes bacterium RBG_16_63_14]|nr:MAG: DNA-directed RNA polymerase subunit omega [Candidatus Aminicenantes bacterium RBG_16_63_14]OGD26547.1 MAG: DNA-directed RNA polymerase subunit omega [Candidatus Aminicenantes bacterium RBG_19FT_COMBO_65_30]